MSTMPTSSTRAIEEIDAPRRSLLSGVLIGIGVAAFIDELVFHQLLHWHHFYDKSTPSWGLISDGMFHALSTFCLVGGLFLFADLRRRGAWRSTWESAGFCFGLGGFQLYDGTFQHKWWRFHQIRYHVDILPYDLVWNVIAAVVILLGVFLYLRARQQPSAEVQNLRARQQRRADAA
jgi:uncharacterized membrane protein